MGRCANCGQTVSETARFCTRCGSPIMRPEAISEEDATRRFPSDQSGASSSDQATSSEEDATRPLPSGQKVTGPAHGQPTGPAYLPPGSSPYHLPRPFQAPRGAPHTAEVNIGKWLSDGWEVYKKDPATFSVAFLLLLILTPLTLTILTGPMMAGFYHMAFKSMRGQKPEVGDLFKGTDRFWPLVFAWVIYLVIGSALNGPSVGFSFGSFSMKYSVLSIFFPLLLAMFTFVFPLILERQRDTISALEEAGRVVLTRNALMFWVCGLIFSVVSFAGFMGCGVGFFITAPIVLCAAAAAYRDMFGLVGPRGQPPSRPLWMDQP